MHLVVVQSAPSLAAGSGSHRGTFLFIMLGMETVFPPMRYKLTATDLDVPLKSNSTAVGRQTLLHNLSGNFTVSSKNNTLLSSTLDEAPAKYIGPSPPAENPPVPHRY